jgi:hypothetical protein
VSDDSSSSWTPPDLSPVWEKVAVQGGFAVVEDWEIGLPEDFVEKFHQTYFNDTTLQHDEGDMPEDRKRARDVIHYKWAGTELKLEEHETIALWDRAGIKGERIHKRVEILADPLAEKLVRTLLCLVPPERRKPEGTFGVNFFRTYTNVVTKPHRDDEQFIITYVMHRTGEGAESYLYRVGQDSTDGSTDKKVLERQLNPGELLFFEDELFTHGATPLVNPPGGTAMRDVLVCTIDNDETYLKPGSAAAEQPSARRPPLAATAQGVPAVGSSASALNSSA